MTNPDTKNRLLKIIGGAVIVIVIAFVALFGVILGTAFKATAPLAESSKAFLADIEAGNYEMAYNETSESFQLEVTYEEFLAFVETTPVLTESNEISFNHRSISNNLGVVSGTISGADGTFPITIRLIQSPSGEQWEVSFISLDPADVPTSDDDFNNDDDFFSDEFTEF